MSRIIKIAREHLPGRDFRVGEMQTLPYADQSFDMVPALIHFNMRLRQSMRSARLAA